MQHADRIGELVRHWQARTGQGVELQTLAEEAGVAIPELRPSLIHLLQHDALGVRCSRQGQVLLCRFPEGEERQAAREAREQCARRLPQVEKACGRLHARAEEELHACAVLLLQWPISLAPKEWDELLSLIYRSLCCGMLLFCRDESLYGLARGMLWLCRLLGRMREWCRLSALLLAAERTHAQRPGDIDALLARYAEVLDEKDPLIALDHLLLGMLHFLRGEFAEVLQCYEAYSLSTPPVGAFDELFSLWVSTGCLYCQRDHISYGIITSHRNTAELTGQNRYALIWRVHNIFFLLRAGDYEQAITHIDQILAVAEDAGPPEMVSVCRRALAMYHFLSRRRKEARRILALDGRGGPALPLTDPRMLEMLVSLEKDGPPIPGYGLREIMSELEKGPSRLLRGVCLRLRAHFPETPASARGRLLRESCEELARTGNVREELLSVRMLVQALEEEGRPEDIPAWKQREKTLLASWRSDRRSKEKPGEHAAFPVCGPCLNAFLRIRPVTRGSAIRHVVGTVQRELGAQRAILLRLYNDERMDYLEAVNVSLTEFEDASFHTIRRALLELLQSSGAGAVFFPLNGNRSAFLLDIDEQTRWLLYLDSELPGSLFSRIGQTEGSAFAAVLSSEFRAAWHLPGEGRRAGQAQDVTPYFGIDMDRVLEQATEALVSDAPLIIHGETGTGKEQMAHFIYTRGDYKGAFVPVQLSSLPEQLFESEMFGHEQGAFTGAHRRKMGFMELAHDGVLFLDEIADISPLIQVKLLRALQEKRFTRVGGVQQQFSNFRLISATNKDIWQEVREGRFREDLAYRLCVIPLELPPLRERPHDLEVLIRQLHTHFLRKYGKAEKPVRAEDMRRLLDYGWPGNIRELYSIMEQYALFGCFRFRAAAEDRPAAPCASEAGECFADLPSMEDMQQRYIRMVLRRTGGKIYGPDGVAAILGMTKSTLYQKMKKYGISRRHGD